MTYKELAAEILGMTAEQQNQDAVVYVKDGQWSTEFIPVDCMSYTTKEVDELDENHPILNLSEEGK